MVVALIVVGILLVSLVIGFPMVIGLGLAALATILIMFPDLGFTVAMQQMYVGLNSFTLMAIPMFMLAAEIMSSGQCADRLLRLVRVFLGHMPGGSAVTAVGTCTLFGAISGSTQATFVAIGRPMFSELRRQRYDDSHIAATLMSSATIALLIPPSISMIIYCVVANCSIADLFIAGIGPGILFCLLFMIFEIVYAHRNNIPREKRADGKEILEAIKGALIPLGFPVIIIGGIYSGIFSPTEGAAISCFYAFFVEKFVYRSISMKTLVKILADVGMVTAECFVLVGTGQILSWVLSYAGIPQALASSIISSGVGSVSYLFIVAIIFFVGCMFMDCNALMYVLVPIFAPIGVQLGIDPIHLGLIIVLQTAIGCITPPFGYNIFTAMAIFDMNYANTCKKLAPYLAICIIGTIVLILFPQISLCLLS